MEEGDYHKGDDQIYGHPDAYFRTEGVSPKYANVHDVWHFRHHDAGPAQCS